MDFEALFSYTRTVPNPRTKLRLYPNGLPQSAVDGIQAIVKEGERRGTNLQRLSYALATAYHETATTMAPVLETRQPSETRNPTVDQAIARLESSWKAGKLPWVKNAYWRKDAQGRSWLGRGLVQLTHLPNYEKMSKKTGVNLVAHPELALEMNVAIQILFEGMEDGDFTGARFSSYIDEIDESDDLDRAEYRLSRKIINGMDKADAIADIAISFEYALKAGKYGQGKTIEAAPLPSPIPAPVPAPSPTPAAPAPTPAPIAPPSSGWGAVIAAIANFFKR